MQRRRLQAVPGCSAAGSLVLRWTIQMQPQFGNVFVVPCGATLRFEWPGEPHGVIRLPSFK